MRYIFIGCLIFIALGFTTCKKAENRACWKSVGKNTTMEITLPSFKKLQVNPKIAVVLVPDTENKLVLRGGKKLLPNIGHDIDEKGFLQLTNNNKCDFLRSYKKQQITAEVHFVDLNEIFFSGSYDLHTKDIIKTTNFILTIQDGAGTVNLNVDCDFLQVYQEHGYGNFILKGSSKQTLLNIKSNGYGDTSDFKVDSTFIVVSISSASSKVNAHQTKDFYVEMNGIGDVFYSGTPQNIHYTRYGKGQLLPQ